MSVTSSEGVKNVGETGVCCVPASEESMAEQYADFHALCRYKSLRLSWKNSSSLHVYRYLELEYVDGTKACNYRD